jgi:hypothetical protein
MYSHVLKIRGDILSIRKSTFTNVKGHTVEYSALNITNDERHYHREAKSQKAQLNSVHKHGIRKDVKVPIKHKLT